MEAPSYKLKWIQHGQQQPYGDSYYTCEIHTEEEMTDDEILLITQEKGRLPKAEWDKRKGNIADYFKGYYTIEKTEYGYLYKGVYPYDDLPLGWDVVQLVVCVLWEHEVAGSSPVIPTISLVTISRMKYSSSRLKCEYCRLKSEQNQLIKHEALELG